MKTDHTGNRLLQRLNAAPALALGFRPFYLAAAVFALLALPLWVGTYLGIVRPGGYFSGVVWHSHEMFFGFAPAVIAGFLLTAVRNWTGRPTPTGAPLAGLVSLWLLARILVLTGPGSVAAIIDLLFLPMVGIAIAIPIWQSRNYRNFKILIILAVLTIANAIFHLSYLNVLPVAMLKLSTTLALDVIVILLAVMGGRVIPAFISGAVPTALPRRNPVVEVVAVGSLVLVAGAGLVEYWYTIPKVAMFALFLVAALANGIRLLLWKPQRTISLPLLWMLPLAYLWLPIALTLRALSFLSIVPAASAIHALTIGAMTSLMIAMMTRSALGHSGRPLVAGTIEITVFMLMQLAAVIRVLAVLVAPGHYQAAVVLSSTIWSLAWALFLVRYIPILTRPRIDGKPG